MTVIDLVTILFRFGKDLKVTVNGKEIKGVDFKDNEIILEVEE